MPEAGQGLAAGRVAEVAIEERAVTTRADSILGATWIEAKEDPMSITTMNLSKPRADARPHANVSPRSARERKQTLHVGTFGGERASPVTVIYTTDVGSFGDAGRK